MRRTLATRLLRGKHGGAQTADAAGGTAICPLAFPPPAAYVPPPPAADIDHAPQPCPPLSSPPSPSPRRPTPPGLSGMGANLFGNYFHFGGSRTSTKPPVKAISGRQAQHGAAAHQAERDQEGLRRHHPDAGREQDAGQLALLPHRRRKARRQHLVHLQHPRRRRVRDDRRGRRPHDRQHAGRLRSGAEASSRCPTWASPASAPRSPTSRRISAPPRAASIAYRADEPGADALGTATTRNTSAT